jgi:hypothetical protein
MLRIILGYAIIAIGAIGGLYLVFGWGLIEPIITIAEKLDGEAISFSELAWEIIKMMVRDLVGVAFFYILFFTGIFIMGKE